MQITKKNIVAVISNLNFFKNFFSLGPVILIGRDHAEFIATIV